MHRKNDQNIRHHSRGLAAGALILFMFSTSLRLLSYPAETSDYVMFVSKWYAALRATPGLSALARPLSDYAPMYLYLLKLLAVARAPSLYGVKSLSVLFDVLLAYFGAKVVTCSGHVDKSTQFFAATVLLCIPTVLINSSVWGQSDSTYASFIVMCLYFILVDCPAWASFAFGVAFSFKLQSVFFGPILLGYLLRKRYWRGFFVVPSTFLLSLVPAWASGDPMRNLLLVYAHQTTEYSALNENSPSIFAFTEYHVVPAGLETFLFWTGISCAGACAVAIALAVVRARTATSARLVLLSLLCVTLVPYLLPRMHERYFYLADVLSVISVFYTPRRWYVAVMIVGASLMAYARFLSSQLQFFRPFDVDIRVSGLLLSLGVAAVVLQEILPQTWGGLRDLSPSQN
jgi:Gpi18-like mannosyltransferase